MKTITRIALAAGLALAASPAFAAHLWIAGDGVACGWSLDDAPSFESVEGNDLLFKGTVYLYGNSDFKFLTTYDWENDELGAAPDASFDADGNIKLAMGKNDEGYGKIQVAEDGNYDITVDAEHNTANIVKSAYQETAVNFPTLYLIGDATAGGWTIDAGTPATQVEGTPYIFTVTTDLIAGEFKAVNALKCGFDSNNTFFRDPTDDTKMVLGGEDDNKWNITEAGTYTVTMNIVDMSISIVRQEEEPQPEPIAVPEALYLIGTVNGGDWDPAVGVEMTKADNVFTASAEVTDNGYIAFTSVLGTWDEVNANRYCGATGDGEELVAGTPATLAQGTGALKMAFGKYIFTVTFGEDAITVLAVVDESGVADVAVEADAAVEYYTLQGVRLNSEPTAAGIYVRRAGQKTSKVAIF
ncbi:MAG: SusF/SusE family outer membrane protein [Muribaculaceae bacterium]